jgi:hypothetical protein
MPLSVRVKTQPSDQPWVSRIENAEFDKSDNALDFVLPRIPLQPDGNDVVVTFGEEYLFLTRNESHTKYVVDIKKEYYEIEEILHKLLDRVSYAIELFEFNDYYFNTPDDPLDFSRYPKETMFVFGYRVTRSATFKFEEAAYVEIHNGHDGAPTIIAQRIDHLRVVHENNYTYLDVRVDEITHIKHLELISYNEHKGYFDYDDDIRKWMDRPNIERLTISCLHEIPSVDIFRHAFDQRMIGKTFTFETRNGDWSSETKLDDIVKICRDNTDILEFHDSEEMRIAVVHEVSDRGEPIVRVVATTQLYDAFRRSFGTHAIRKSNRDAPWVRLRTILLNAPMTVRYIVVDDKPLIINFDFDNVVPGQLSIRLGPRFKLHDFDRLTRVQLPVRPIKFVELFDRTQLGRDENNRMLIASSDRASFLPELRKLFHSRVHRVFCAEPAVEIICSMLNNYGEDMDDVINPDWVMEGEDDEYIEGEDDEYIED